MRSRPAFALILRLSMAVAGISSLLAPGANAVERRVYSDGDYACTNKEAWTWGPGVSRQIREKIKGPPSGRNAAVDTFIVGYAVKLVAKTPETSALGEYFMYRAFYELGLLHFADRGFSAILGTAPDPTTTGIKLAALSCMNEIHRKYPSLGIAYNSGWSLGQINLKKVTEYERNSVWQAMATIAGRKIFVSGRNAQLQYELPLLQGSGAYDSFVRMTQATILEQDSNTIAATERFLKYPTLPEYLKAQEDGAHLNLARVYYQDQKYAKSIAEFKKVNPQSNFFSRALNDAAWPMIMLKQYSDAAGSSYNLMTGNLKRTFEPEAPVVIGMALFENCHYKEAAETLTVFKKTYDRPYHWLYEWYHNQKIGPAALYPLAINYLHGSKKVPEAVASEWVRSPVFIAEQQELNLSFDENQIAKDLVSAVEKASKSESQKLRTTFKGLVANFVKKLPETQKSITDKINQELASRNNAMIAGMVEAFETAQLIEVEIYNQAGEDMIRKGNRGAPKEIAKVTHSTDGAPALDWGRAPSSDDDDAETWDDELGAIQTDVTNICKKK